MYFNILKILQALVFAFKTTLNCRQLHSLTTCTSHKTLKGDHLKKAISYNKDKQLFIIMKSFFFYLIDLILLSINLENIFLKYFDEKVVSMTLFYLIYSFLIEMLFLPFDYFYYFSLENKYGFNNMTLTVFITDFVKQSLLSFIANFLGFYFLLRMILSFKYFFVFAFLGLVSLQLFVLIIYPTHIQPLFNKFRELKGGFNEGVKDRKEDALNENDALNEKEKELKEKIEELICKINSRINSDIKLKKIFVMDGSKRSEHSNAYFIGLFKEKRIVLFDTLIKQLDIPEILGVLAHEYGHAHKKHNWKILGSFFFIQLCLLIAYNFTRNLKRVLIIDLIYFLYVFNGCSVFLNYLLNLSLRAFEKEADAFGVKMGLGEELKAALTKLHKDNKSSPVNDPWYSVYTYSHPPLDERIKFIDSQIKRLK